MSGVSLSHFTDLVHLSRPQPLSPSPLAEKGEWIRERHANLLMHWPSRWIDGGLWAWLDSFFVSSRIFLFEKRLVCERVRIECESGSGNECEPGSRSIRLRSTPSTRWSRIDSSAQSVLSFTAIPLLQSVGICNTPLRTACGRRAISPYRWVYYSTCVPQGQGGLAVITCRADG